MDVSRTTRTFPVTATRADQGPQRQRATGETRAHEPDRAQPRARVLQRDPASVSGRPEAERGTGHEGAEALLDGFLEARNRIGDRMRNGIQSAGSDAEVAAFRDAARQANEQLETRFLGAISTLQPAGPADGSGAQPLAPDALLDSFLSANRSITQTLRSDIDGLTGVARREAHVDAQAQRQGLQDRLLNALGFGPRPGEPAGPDQGPEVLVADVDTTRQPGPGVETAAPVEAPVEAPGDPVSVSAPSADVDVESELAERLFEAVSRIDDRARNAISNAENDEQIALIRERAGEARDLVANRFLNALSFERGNPLDFEPDAADRELISNFLEERFRSEQRMAAGIEANPLDGNREAFLAAGTSAEDSLTTRFLDALSAPEAPAAAPNDPANDPASGARFVSVSAGDVSAERVGNGAPSTDAGPATQRPFFERFTSMLDRFEQRADRLTDRGAGPQARSQFADQLQELHNNLEQRFQHLIQGLRGGSSEEA